MNANRSRSPLAYLLPHGGETAIGGRHPPYHRYPGWLLRRYLPQGTPSRPLRKHRHGQAHPVSRMPHADPQTSGPAKTAAMPKRSSWCCERFRSPARSSKYVRSDGADEGRPQVLVDRLLGNPE